MTLPKQIKCGAYVYTVVYEDRLENKDHRRLQGQACLDQLTIKIDTGMDFQLERETLLHEVLHTVEKDRNLDLSENDINQLSYGLAAALLDNPEWTRLFLPGGEF